MKVRFKKLNENAVIPFKRHDRDYCYDVVAVSEEQIAPNVWKYGLGFAIQLDKGGVHNEDLVRWCFSLRPRSSVWKTGMVLSNSVGTVDEDYTGEVSAVFYHVMPEMPRYRVGDRIAQMCIEGTSVLDFKESSSLEDTERGDGGYGSTGR